ncbi:MAG: hypothetical protein ACI8PT_003087, partial [Gammaproteobacteria bacterium]
AQCSAVSRGGGTLDTLGKKRINKRRWGCS